MHLSRSMIAPFVALPLFFAARANAQEAVTVVNDQPPAAQPPPPGQPVQNAQPAQNTQMAPQPAPYERTTHGTPGEIDEDEGSGPRPRVGFQMDFRTGYAIPMGNATGVNGDKMTNSFGGEVPFILDIGGKVHKNIFVGGYLNLAFGGCGDFVTSNCAAVTFHIGPEILINFIPDGKVNPWAGYGFGLEVAALSADNGNSSVSASGWEFGHFMGGVDFRLTRGFGIGPFLDLSLAEYTHESVTSNGVTLDGSINSTALHEWLTLGVKLTIFP